MGCNEEIPLDSAFCYPRSPEGLIVNQSKHTNTPTLPISLSFSLFTIKLCARSKETRGKKFKVFCDSKCCLSTWRPFENYSRLFLPLRIPCFKKKIRTIKRCLGIYRFLPLLFITEAGIEPFMIKVRIGKGSFCK